MIRQVYNLTDSMMRDCYYIVSYFMGNASDFYYSVQNKVNSGKSVMFVHEVNGVIKGFLIGAMQGKKVAVINNLYVNADAQRQGIGAALLKAYENYNYVRGVKSFSLMSRPTKQALDFYQKQGYARLGQSNKMIKSL